MRVGSIVECVGRIAPYPGVATPAVGERYTIRAIERYRLGFGVLLDEIINPPHPDFDGEPAYHMDRFREIEFPPSLMLEIKESLTKELELI